MSATKFAKLLTKAVRIIAARKDQSISSVQDMLGYALGREGRYPIEYWRKGHSIPSKLDDVEKLTRELRQRGGFLDRADCEHFLRSVDYPDDQRLLDELFPPVSNALLHPTPIQESLSPFVVGPPITHPRQFFGRERELQQIFALWGQFPMQHMALIGQKRSGKTSLLHYVKDITRTLPAALRRGQRRDWLSNPEHYQWVFVHFQDPRLQQQQGLMHHILTSLEIAVPTPCTLDTFVAAVSRRLQGRAVILIDEISAALACPELDQRLWWALRALANNYTQGHLAFLVTAHDVPAQLASDYGKPSPFFNIFHTMKLGPFTETEARELIANAPEPFADEDVDWILARSGGWPVLVQILCHTRLLALKQGLRDIAWREEGLRQIASYCYLLDA